MREFSWNYSGNNPYILIGQYSPGVPEELDDGRDGGEGHAHDEDEEGPGHVLHSEGLGCGGGRLADCLGSIFLSSFLKRDKPCSSSLLSVSTTWSSVYACIHSPAV